MPNHQMGNTVDISSDYFLLKPHISTRLHDPQVMQKR